MSGPGQRKRGVRAEQPLELFVPCAPGLSGLLAQELGALGLEGAQEAAGVGLRGDLALVGRLNLWLRTASRVLVRLGSFPARSFGQLEHEAALLPFERALAPGQKVALRVTCRKSRLYHSGAVADRLAGAIAARLGRAPEVVKPSEAGAEEEGQGAQLLIVRLEDDVCTVSADSSGALLHRRGFRTQLSQAPLRETLAAALLLAAGYRGEAMLDPCCGAGTIPLEAALLAAGLPPGLSRPFACEAWPGFPKASLERQRSEARGRPLPARLAIGGADLDPRAVAAAQANAGDAGLAALVPFEVRRLEELQPPPGWSAGMPCLVACNPPYGRRVGAGLDLRALYAALGKGVRERLPGARLALVCEDDQLAACASPLLRCLVRTENGGAKVGLWVEPHAVRE
jgi:putative N6-adenine-specific DNA methylase